MAEQRQGQSFVKHEFEEAITIQQAIVEGERELSQSAGLPEAQEQIKAALPKDEECLKRLQQFGQQFGVDGAKDPISSAMEQLMQESGQSASKGPESEKYEAQAVLLTLKRKQTDAAGAIAEIAKQMGNPELKAAAIEIQKAMKSSADDLASSLAKLAVTISRQGNGTHAGAAQ